MERQGATPLSAKGLTHRMDFELSPEQIALRGTVREFAEAEIRPHVMEWDEAQAFPLDVVKHLGQLGILGTIFPEDLGGAGMGYADYVVAIEELARVDPSVALIVAAHVSLCTNHIYQHGNEAQRRRYVPKLASGEWIGCWSITEPEAGSDAAGTRTTARLEDGRWILNGSKTFTTNAQKADVCVAMAVTDPGEHHYGISAFVIEKDTPGFEIGRKENKLGMRASDTGEVLFRDCAIPEANLLGKRGDGFIGAMKILDGGRISIAALSVGIAQGAYEAALSYSKQRQQFGKPIAEFQAIRNKLADMATEIEAARLVTYEAAWLADQGKPVTRVSSMAKLFASETSVRVANEAVQVHGGYGFIKDYPVEKFYRDAKLMTIGEGTSEVQRLVISREILKS
jgi:alkylation response protein AidB-like acyl-CoA dehydrogenase